MFDKLHFELDYKIKFDFFFVFKEFKFSFKIVGLAIPIYT